MFVVASSINRFYQSTLPLRQVLMILRPPNHLPFTLFKCFLQVKGNPYCWYLPKISPAVDGPIKIASVVDSYGAIKPNCRYQFSQCVLLSFQISPALHSCFCSFNEWATCWSFPYRATMFGWPRKYHPFTALHTSVIGSNVLQFHLCLEKISVAWFMLHLDQSAGTSNARNPFTEAYTLVDPLSGKLPRLTGHSRALQTSINISSSITIFPALSFISLFPQHPCFYLPIAWPRSKQIANVILSLQVLAKPLSCHVIFRHVALIASRPRTGYSPAFMLPCPHCTPHFQPFMSTPTHFCPSCLPTSTSLSCTSCHFPWLEYALSSSFATSSFHHQVSFCLAIPRVSPQTSTACHVMSSHVKSCHVIPRCVSSCHVTSCHVVSRPVMSCHVGCPEGCRFHTASAVYKSSFNYYQHPCA